jgi:hypothetical protein
MSGRLSQNAIIYAIAEIGKDVPATMERRANCLRNNFRSCRNPLLISTAGVLLALYLTASSE